MEEEKSLKINQESMDVLVANVIPTTKYFESRFDHMQYQIDEIKKSQENMQKNIDKRFDDMQKDIDKRFDAVDKRFEKVEHNIEELTKSINNLTLRVEQLAKTQETTIRDYIIERDRHYDMKFNNLRMFNIATITIVSGILLKMMGIINI
jgi:chromosome segregation ATPase